MVRVKAQRPKEEAKSFVARAEENILYEEWSARVSLGTAAPLPKTNAARSGGGLA